MAWKDGKILGTKKTAVSTGPGGAWRARGGAILVMAAQRFKAPALPDSTQP